ncbi:hypothetical protein DQ04_00031260 [Trypanosoma grayi]|uniref:hypothetical protein n=1 Tax=Trypanosoma grayi TaxID=71804 RepID=UPI0004F3F67B|nr:hypothetical protein DQ04_00031260 [Trypanosoma grayi]KEG15592.1 hypothetical protein DQ04_00031260 [Trypanosoma grayi]
MEGLWEVLKDAHMEVLNATGWGTLFNGVVGSWSGEGDGMLRYYYKQVAAFVAAVNWSEPFFTYLAAFHVTVVLVVVALTWRASTERIFVVDLVVLLLGWCSSYLNDLGNAYASKIFVEDGVNYFDRSGLFVSVVYWLPLFFVALVLQGCILLQVLRLMVATKRRQLQQEMRNRAATTTATKSAGKGTTKAKKEK